MDRGERERREVSVLGKWQKLKSSAGYPRPLSKVNSGKNSKENHVSPGYMDVCDREGDGVGRGKTYSY